MMTKYDFIGDIHGYATKLEQLLTKLNYKEINGVYQHGSRTAFFVGDFIDRGPNIRRVLQIVKSMCDYGAAKAVMGNHEYNALCYHTLDKQGQPLRQHSPKNQKQHQATLQQFATYSDEWKEYLQWFIRLPLFYEKDEFRVVHACWDEQAIQRIRNELLESTLTLQTLRQSADKSNPLFQAIETTLKGKEVKMPNGLSFYDKDGNLRHHIRVKWWLNALETTFKEYSIISIDDLPEHNEGLHQVSYYQPEDRPVFFGHYWLKGKPNLYRGNICCLDYSVAKEGYLAAYRYNGEQQLSNNQFVFV